MMKRRIPVLFFASALAGLAFGAEFHYHSRHIPAEHLDLTKYWAKVTRDGGLCDCLEPEEETVLSAFRKSGGSVTDGSEFPPPPDPLVFTTRHRTFTSSFIPETGEIKIEKVRQGDK